MNLRRCRSIAIVLSGGALLASGCASLQGPTAPAQAGAAALAAEVDTVTAHATQAAREAQLQEQPHWQLQGRIAFVRGQDSAHARIEWVQRGADYEIRLTAPVTGRSWRLRGQDGRAQLEGVDGGLRESADAEALLYEATGWILPVRHWSSWVRAARGQGPASGLRVDAGGLPITWEQSGWHLRFPDWLAGEPPLPRRVFAERGEARVRLVVERWESLP